MLRRQDRRILRTRHALQDALFSLLLKRNYDNIVVEDILNTANVGRATFYMHFKDKDDLLMSSVRNLQKFLRGAQSGVVPPTATSYERLIAFSLPMFRHSAEVRPIFRTLLRSKAGPRVSATIHQTLVTLISREASKLKARRAKSVRIPLDMLSHYVASTFNSVLTSFFENKKARSAKSMDNLFRALVLPTLREYFK